MSRVTAVLAGLLIGSVVAVNTAAADDDQQAPQFRQAKNGLLMSPGVIRLIEKEGEISLEDERITCQRVRKTGSHLRETFCLTVEEAEIARLRNQTTMWRYMQGVTR